MKRCFGGKWTEKNGVGLGIRQAESRLSLRTEEAVLCHKMINTQKMDPKG